jgi:hypothetical protein
MTTACNNAGGRPPRWAAAAGLAFMACVLVLAFYGFAANTADPDLWGHVLFGHQALLTGVVERADSYSWTAAGAPWINHEALAEILMALAHRVAGGAGLFWLMTCCGLATWWLALRLGAERLDLSERWVAWGLAAVASVEIAFGFAARPQMFTGLALAVLLWLLRRVTAGRIGWAVALPLLFALWINLHGGALAGWALLWLTALAVSPLERLAGRWRPLTPTPRRVRVAVCLAAITATLALLANPWGVDLIRWLVASVSWLRPEIEEWNPTPWGWDHAPFFALLALTAGAWIFSKRPKSLWEAAVLGALALVALRSVRHTPLFCIAALALAPPYVADALRRGQTHLSRLAALARQPVTQTVACLVFTLLAAAILIATWQRDRDTWGTMAVPRAQYPLAAIEFIRQHELTGNLLVFFDWGELCLWELPASAVSFDGRLDTCYPRPVITEHWKLYRGQPCTAALLDLNKASVALLPHLPGTERLAWQPGWTVAYVDPLAVVLVRDLKRFPRLAALTLPVQAGPSAVTGRARFPDAPPKRLPASPLAFRAVSG